MKRSSLLVVILILIFSVFAYADDKTTIDITQVGMGARPIALGAYTGLADDASAVFTNPGGIGLQDRLSFVSMSTQLLTTVNYQVASVVYPTQYGNFGVGYIGVSSPAGEHIYYDARNYGGRRFDVILNSMYVLSYGTDISSFVSDRFDHRWLRSQGRFRSQREDRHRRLIWQHQGRSFSFRLLVDLGLLCELNDSLRVGATLQNPSAR